MTDDQARAILTARGVDYIAWNSEAQKPNWQDSEPPEIVLDGSFTAEQLRAILHFAP